MGTDYSGLGRALIFFGVIFAGCGMVLLLAPRVPWLGRLPGDIFIQRPGFTFYFPLASCLLASLLLSLLFWILGRWR